MTAPDDPARGAARRAPRARTPHRTWTHAELAELARTQVRTDVPDGYLEINREALDELLARQSDGRAPSHAQASLLLRMLARAGWQKGREGLVLGSQARVCELTRCRSVPAFSRLANGLVDAGLLVELKRGRATVGYVIQPDVYDWLTHPDRPRTPEAVLARDRRPGPAPPSRPAGG